MGGLLENYCLSIGVAFSGINSFCSDNKTNGIDVIIEANEIAANPINKLYTPRSISQYNSLKFSSLSIGLQEKFENDKIRLSRYVGNDKDSLNTEFYKCLSNIYVINPEKVVFSLTSSKSISFRIYKNNYEIHLESFYTKDDEDDNIEAVFSIHKDGVKIINDYGELYSSFEKILNTVYDYQEPLVELSFNTSIYEAVSS